MAYTKQTWANGDTITAEKLNHMEDGIAGGGSAPLIIDTIYDEIEDCNILNKTWQEIYDAYIVGTMCIIREEHIGDVSRFQLVRTIVFEEDLYQVDGYTTDSPNGYPNDGGK